MILQLNEIDILRVTHHPHIVKLLAFYEDERHFNIVLEYLEGKDLFGHLESKVTDEEQVKTMVTQIADALDYLHN